MDAWMRWGTASAVALVLCACGDDGTTTGTGTGGAGTGGDGSTTSTTSSQSSGGGGQAPSELCANGVDDDADTLVDCADDDCATECQDTCAVATTVLDPSITMGSTAGYGDATDGSCATAAGAEHVYQVTATATGDMTVKVVSFSDLAVSVRSSCADAMTEVGCSNVTSGSGDETVTLGVTAGDTYFIVVEGGAMASDYQLEVETIENVACATAAPLSDPGTVMGTTNGPSYLDPLPQPEGGQCPMSATHAPEKVFVVTAAADGVLEASLDAAYDAVLYLRKACTDGAGERCADKAFNPGMPEPEKTSIAVSQGDTVYVIVDGWEMQSGDFTLHVASRPVACGDGILDPGEACEDSGPNDGCSALCTIEACDGPIAASEGTVQGDLTGGPPGFVDTACQPDAKSPEDVYEIIANETGTMVVTTTAAAPTDVGVEVRTDCADATTVLACADPAPPSPDKVGVQVVQGQTYLIVVKSFTPMSAGPYSLNIDVHQPACGDGFTEGMEQCDDGDTTSGDGCSATCTNETTSCMAPIVLADPSNDTFSIGMPADSVMTCNPGGDVVFSIVADQTGVLDVTTDPFVGIAIRPTCNDMTGELRCTTGSTSVPVTAGETYFIVASPQPLPMPGGTFHLSVSTRVPICGDGVKDVGEECDDANMDNTDGCTDQCVIVATETESNDTPMTADSFVSPFVGVISPQTDVDYVAVTVPGPASNITATVVDGPLTTCGSTLPRIDSLLTLFGTNGTTQLAFNDDIMVGTSFCSSVSATNLPAGTYYLQVKAYGMTPGFDYGLSVVVN